MALLLASPPELSDFPPLLQSPPKFWFGDLVRYRPRREKAEVVGLSWQKTDDPACLDGWYYHLRLLNIDSSHFRACHIGGEWAEEMGHESDLVRIK